MSLKPKIIFILLGMALAYCGLDHLTHQLFIMPSFVTLEREAANKDMGRCVEVIKQEIKTLSHYCCDWSQWDDAYQFMQDRNQDYLKSNFVDSTYTISGYNLILHYDNQGRRVAGGIFDLVKEEHILLDEFPPTGLPVDHILLRQAGKKNGISGIVSTSRGPMLVAARSILTSECTGPSRGTVIVGYFLTDDRIQLIRRQAIVDLSIWPATSPQIPPIALNTGVFSLQPGNSMIVERDERELLIYSTFPDLAGKPLILLQVLVPRKITTAGNDAVFNTIFVYSLAGLSMLFLVIYLVQKTVLGPLTKITLLAIRVGKDDDLTARIETDRKDEIGILSQEFNNMIAKLQTMRNELVDRSYFHGKSEMAADVFHNVRNSLTPIISHVVMAQDKIMAIPSKEIHRSQQELCQGNLPPDRQKKLWEFLGLATVSLEGMVQDANLQLYEIINFISEIESILDTKETEAEPDFHPPLENCRPAQIVEDALCNLKHELGDQITLSITPDLLELAPIRTNRLTLQLVFQNIIINALEAIQIGGITQGRIDISGERIGVDSDRLVRLTIKDNGGGMTPAVIEQVFNREFSTKKHSSGQGLHWCANAILESGGRISAESGGEGQGSKIHIWLPCNIPMEVTN